MDLINISNTAWSAPVYATPALEDMHSGANPAAAATKAFDAMIFRLLLQSVNLFGTERDGGPWAGLWQGVIADQWAQELAAQHTLSFGAALFNEQEEGGS